MPIHAVAGCQPKAGPSTPQDHAQAHNPAPLGMTVVRCCETQRSSAAPPKIFASHNRCIYIYCCVSQSPLPKLPCAASSVRRASRALTQMYEHALRPHGLRATQFTILQFLSLAGEVSQGRVGKMLAIDSTTLTRTLEIMLRQGWVAERPGEDRRERLLRLSKAGKAQLYRALPDWEKVQSQLQQELGEQIWKELFQLTNKLTELATATCDLQ